MSTINLKDIVKHYGQVVALRDLSIDIHDGEFFVIMGASGAGKTTTLKVIAGIEPITSGLVAIDGADMTQHSPRDRDVAMVFESFSLYPHKDVFENIAFPLRAPGSHLTEEEISGKVTSVAELLRIDQLLDRRPDQLSGGQRQRVALARAVVREPRAFLMDEPLSHLDARIRYRMRAELRRLADTIRVTSVYVTHDYVEALVLGERMAVIDRGEVLQIGPPRVLFDQPASSRVAQLIGQPEINLIEGSLEPVDGQPTYGAGVLMFVSAEGELSIPFSPPPGHTLTTMAGEHVILGIRPHHINLAPASRPDGTRARVVNVEDHITKYLGIVSVGDSLLRVMSASELSAGPGEDVTLDVSPHHCLLFEATSHNLLGTMGGSW